MFNSIWLILGIIIPVLLGCLYHFSQKGKLPVKQSTMDKINGFPAWDIVLALSAVALVITILTLTTSKAEAAEKEGWFPEPPTVFFTLEQEFNSPSVFCNRSGAGHLVANIGMTQVIYRRWGIDFIGKGTHHSCSWEEDDKESYDALGIGFEWQP